MLIAQRHESLSPGKKRYVGTSPAETPELTNKKFSENKLFMACCKAAEVEPTTRQASKFRMKKGSAYAARHRVGGTA